MLIVPMSIARFASYAGANVPVAFTFLADFIFALGGRLCSPPLANPALHLTGAVYIGFANLMLFLGTRRFIPDVNTIPDLATPRSRLDKTSSQATGITPFVLTSKDAEDKPGVMMTAATASDGEVTVSWSETRLNSEMQDPNLDASSPLSAHSHESTQPLSRPREERRKF